MVQLLQKLGFLVFLTDDKNMVVDKKEARRANNFASIFYNLLRLPDHESINIRDLREVTKTAIQLLGEGKPDSYIT